VKAAAFLATAALAVLVAGLSAGAALQTAEAQPAGAAIDRQFLCATSLSGGIHQLEVRGHTGVKAGRSPWTQLPFVVFSSGGSTIGGDLLRSETLAFITAGRPTALTTIDQDWRKSSALPPGRLAVNMRACRPTSRAVPFSRAGLDGGLASRFGDEIDCEVPRRVLLRVRAILRGPGGFQRMHGFERLLVPLRQARLTARTEAGRTIVDAEVLESGRTTIHTAKTCYPD
jgi:hypothetical protein